MKKNKQAQEKQSGNPLLNAKFLNGTVLEYDPGNEAGRVMDAGGNKFSFSKQVIQGNPFAIVNHKCTFELDQNNHARNIKLV